MCKKIIQMISSLVIIVIGIYMLVNFGCGTAPHLSGLAFLLIGLNLWMPHCLILKIKTSNQYYNRCFVI